MARFPTIYITLIITLIISLAISIPYPVPRTTSLTLPSQPHPSHNTTIYLTTRDDDDDDGFANDSNHDGFNDDTKYPNPLDPTMVTARGCAPKPSHPFVDAHEKKLYAAVTKFCKNSVIYHRAETRPMEPITAIIDTTGPKNPEIKDTDVFNGSVAEVRGCGSREDVLNLMHPMPIHRDDVQGYDCLSILYGAWKWCNGNKGRGGWVQSGCLNYSMYTVY